MASTIGLIERGGIDAVIAHAPALEERLIADDPAGARDSGDPVAALRRIADQIPKIEHG